MLPRVDGRSVCTKEEKTEAMGGGGIGGVGWRSTGRRPTRSMSDREGVLETTKKYKKRKRRRQMTREEQDSQAGEHANRQI